MKRTRTIRLSENFKIIFENSGFITLTITFVVCFLIGNIFIFKNATYEGFIRGEFEGFYNIRLLGSFGTILMNSLLFIVPCALLSFVCGTSIVGCVLSPIFLIYKGFILGSYTGYIYVTHQLEGIIFNALIIIPSAIISIFALILSVRESVGFSVNLARLCIKGKNSTNLFYDFKNYCYKHIAILFLIIFSILLDLSCSALFIKFFKF